MSLSDVACVCLVSEPSQSLASHRRARGAYWKINGVNAKQVTGRCGKEGFLLIKQEKAFDVALGTCSLMGETIVVLRQSEARVYLLGLFQLITNKGMHALHS